MPQDVGVAGDPRSVRELLLSLAPRALRLAGEHVLEHEAQLEGGDAAAGMRLGMAIADWSALGGYELEGEWDAACRRIVHASFEDLADRPALTSQEERRKRLVLDTLFASDAEVLLLDEPDSFLDVPGFWHLERQIRGGSKKTVPMSLLRSGGALGRGRIDPDARGKWRVAAWRPLPQLSTRAWRAPSLPWRRGRALARRGAPAVPADEDVFRSASATSSDWPREGRRR